jgi:hypothetical protein
MAYQFQYNPGVVDRSGEILAAGLEKAQANIARGIMEYRKKKEDDEMSRSAMDYALKSGLVQDEGEAKAAIKAAGGGREALQFLQGMEQRKQQAEQQEFMRRAYAAQAQQQAAQQQAQQAAAMREQQARTAALGDKSLSHEQKVMAYLDQGGGDREVLQALLSLKAGQDLANKPTKPMPGSAGYGKVDVPGVGTAVVDQATGELIDSGKFSKAPEKKSDKQSLATTEIQRINAMQQASRDLQSLEQAYNEIGDKDWGGPLAGRLKPGFGETKSRIENLINSSTPNLARGVFGEVGVLTDEDVKRYKDLLPNANDTAKVRAQKFADLRTKLEGAKKETIGALKAAGREVGEFEKMFEGSGESGPQADLVTPAGEDFYADENGVLLPIRVIRGQRGIMKAGKFYPIQG